MSAPKVQPSDYIDFLIATPKACSGTEAARVQPDDPDAPAHDAFTRLLTRLDPDPATLWTESEPRCVAFDGWYSSLDNLKLIRTLGWTWLTRLKPNRLVNVNRQGTRALKDTVIAATGTEVWLPGFGLVKVFGSPPQTVASRTGPPTTWG